MRFCEFAKFMHENYEANANDSEFVSILIDAILDESALEKEGNPNPIYGLSANTRLAYYSGKRQISQRKAAQIVPNLSEESFDNFVSDYSMDALEHMRDKLGEYGFDVEPYEVGKACANILAQIIKRRSEGLSDDVTKLDYKRLEKGQRFKNIAPASIERRGDKLEIAGETITINQALVPDSIAEQELEYIHALYEVFAEKLNRENFTKDDMPLLNRGMRENFREQREAYYSAVSVERSVRDMFTDGEDEFQILKDDAWHGIDTTYWKDYPDGYARLNAVLEKVTSTSLDRSILSQMRNLIGNLEKKGICHILVNDGTIESWVHVND